jgi:predicted nucleotidyltransferase
MNSGMDQSRAQDKPKEIPVEVTVGKIIEKIKPELTLDALQEIAISNILMESIKTQGMLIKAEVSQEDKIKNIQALSEVTDRKIMELLNKDQKEKYTAMNEEAKNPKKSKAKKKAKQ